MPSSGIHGTSVASIRATDLAQAALGRIRIRSRLEAERRAHRRAHREVRRRRLVLLAARVQDPEVRRAGDQLLDQPRLAEPGGPPISTMQPLPVRARRRPRSSAASSASRPTNGVSALRSPLRPTIGPTIDASTGSALPLAWNGSIGVVSNIVRDRSSTISVDEDLARPRLGHDPRGRVDRVAEDAVGAPVRRAEVAGEDLAGVDADPHRDDARLLHHLAQRPEHPLLVVARARRGARGQQRLDAALPTSDS